MNGRPGPGPVRKPCPACGRPMAGHTRGIPVGGKGRARHKCPHGRWCVAGDPRMRAGGWNPGDRQHARFCRECAELVRAREHAP